MSSDSDKHQSKLYSSDELYSPDKQQSVLPKGPPSSGIVPDRPVAEGYKSKVPFLKLSSILPCKVRNAYVRSLHFFNVAGGDILRFGA